MVLANAIVPLSGLAPALQVLLLVGVVVVESAVVRRRLGAEAGRALVRGVAVGNLATAALGAALAYGVVRFVEAPVVFGAGGGVDWQAPPVWRHAVYALGLPWLVWFACYQVSWRVEHRVLAARRDAKVEPLRLRDAVVAAHRVTYGLLAVPLAGVTVFVYLFQ